MTETRPEVERIIELYKRVYRELRASFAEQWMRLDSTMPQLKVLLYLHTDGPSRMSDLAAALRLSMPSATGIVDRLVQRGLVIRDQSPDDRRVVTCSLSGEGEERISSLWAASFDPLREILAPLPPEALDTITRAAELVLEAAKRINGKGRTVDTKTTT